MIRNSKELDHLLLLRPSAVLLLLLIAKRAKRSDDHPDATLALGEALIGDYKSYGATESTYRTDKSALKLTGQVTFRSTNKGTIAKIVRTSIFDICINEITDNLTDKLTVNQRTDPLKLTTNKNDKNGKNNISIDTFSKEELRGRYPDVDVDTEVEKMIDWLASTGKKYKDYPAFARGWLRRISPIKKQESDHHGYDMRKKVI